VKDLPLQVGEIDTVEIDDPEGSNAGCRQIKRSRGAETASADAHNPRCFKSFLSLYGYFGHDEMPGVALQFLREQLHHVGTFFVDDTPLHVIALL
jgi:hypothetical protein